MKFCSYCGIELNEQNTCPKCGKVFHENRLKELVDKANTSLNNALKDVNIKEEVQDASEYEKKDKEENKAMAALSYLFAPVPYLFFSKKSKFIKFHASQGMNIFIVVVLYIILYNMVYKDNFNPPAWYISYPVKLLGILVVVLVLVGFFNAIAGNTKRLPIIGKYKLFK